MLFIIQVPGQSSSLDKKTDLCENPLGRDIFTIPVVSGNWADAIYVPTWFAMGNDPPGYRRQTHVRAEQ